MGHDYLNYHRSLADPSVNKACRLCGEDREESWYLIANCEALAWKSYETFRDNNLKKMPHPKLVLKYIRDMRIVAMMEPPAEEEAGEQEEANN